MEEKTSDMVYDIRDMRRRLTEWKRELDDMHERSIKMWEEAMEDLLRLSDGLEDLV